MKKILLSCFLAVSACSLMGQNFRIQAPPGYNYIYPENSTLKGTEGSPFLDDWSFADVYFTSTGVLNDIAMRYNVLTDQMMYKQNDKTYIMGAPDSILEVRFPGKRFIYQSYTKDKEAKKGFFELVLTGKVTLLVKYEIEVTPANYNEALMSGNKNDVLNIVQKLYIKKGANIVPINKKTVLFEQLGDKKAEVATYVSKNRLSFKKKKDMILLINYYNQLS